MGLAGMRSGKVDEEEVPRREGGATSGATGNRAENRTVSGSLPDPSHGPYLPLLRKSAPHKTAGQPARQRAA